MLSAKPRPLKMATDYTDAAGLPWNIVNETYDRIYTLLRCPYTNASCWGTVITVAHRLVLLFKFSALG